MIDYVAARQLAYVQEEGNELIFDDYTHFLNNRAEDDQKNLAKKSFQGIDLYDWEEALVADMVLDCSRISEEVRIMSLMKSLKQKQQMIRPQVQQILQDDVNRIEVEQILEYFETPLSQSIEVKLAHQFPDELEVFSEGISFIGDRKISDDEVRGVNINRLGKIIFPVKCLQEQICQKVIRGLIDYLLGQNGRSNKKGSSLLDQSVSQISSRKIDSEQEQGKSLSKKLKPAENNEQRKQEEEVL